MKTIWAKGGSRITVPEILEKMIAFSKGNLHDIEHFMKVWAYARTIGELEQLDPETQFILEVAAITHDIACPLCRKKYGNTHARYQEEEGAVLIQEFLSDAGMTEEQVERVSWLIGHHHTLDHIDGLDYQILVEADYIVNACENGYTRGNIVSFMQKIMRTESGKRLMQKVFCL